MCRLLMNFVLTQEGLPFTVLLTRGGNNRARYVRAIKESYATGSCAPMVRRVLYAIDEAGRALERFRGAGNEPVEGPGKSTRFRGACEEESEGRDELDRLEGPCEKRCQGDGVQPASKGVGREARELVRGAQEERGATAGGAECRSTGSEEEKIGGSLPGKNAMGQKEVSTKPVNEVRKTTAREDACTAGQQLLSGRLERQSVCRASESQRAGSADHQIANERSTGAVPNPGSAAVVSACNRAVSDDLLRPESRTAAVRTEDVSQQRPEAPPCPAVLPSARALHACPEDGEGRQSEPCGRPFLDEVPEANGRQVYGEKEGRKRGRSPSVTSSSSGGGSAGDAGSDDTGTSEGSEGGGQGPGGNGGGGGGDSEDTGGFGVLM